MHTIDQIKKLVTDGTKITEFVKDAEQAKSIPFPTYIKDGAVFYETNSVLTHKMVEHTDGTFHLEEI